MRGVIILGHGSRNPKTNDEFMCFVEGFKDYFGKGIHVHGAFLEFHHDTLEEMTHRLYGRGIREISLLPYFLFGGKHLNETIPLKLQDLRKRYRDLDLILLESIGENPLIKKIIIESIEKSRDRKGAICL